MGFDVRLLLLPQDEDPDTWCLKLGAEGFRELIRNAPDWTAFTINRALEGKDLRRIPDRMEALRELAGFLVYLPVTPERRELFAGLAHQLQIPLTELDHAVAARTTVQPQPSPDAPLPSAPVVMDVDELIRPLLVLCRNPELRARAAQLPPAWWEALSGAPLLQCLLDAEGDEGGLPEDVLAQVRHLEAKWSVKDEAEQRPEQIFMKLEMAYVERERQTLNRQLQDPAVLADPALLRRLETQQGTLLARASQLRKVSKEQRRQSFST
jgi:DNA primase